MEVLVGPTFTIDVSSTPPAYGGTEHNPGHEKEDRAVPACLFMNEVDNRPKNDGSGCGRPDFFAGDLSESSSSIGTPDDSDIDLSPKRDADLGDGDEEEEVQSKFNGGVGLGSLDSLEDSLPIKRGLSSHFNGKSKSFTDLSQVTTVNELKKPENPFNKRRRILMASKLSRKSGFYSWSNPKSMPLLPVDEDEDFEEEKARKVSSPLSASSSLSTEEKKQEEQLQKLQNNRVAESCATRMRLRLGSFKSRSFSLADLQEHDDEEDDD